MSHFERKEVDLIIAELQAATFITGASVHATQMRIFEILNALVQELRRLKMEEEEDDEDAKEKERDSREAGQQSNNKDGIHTFESSPVPSASTTPAPSSSSSVAPPPALWRESAERALRELALGDFSAKEGAVTLPLCELLREAWSLLYWKTDTKNMLTLAGEFQDACLRNKKLKEPSQVASLYCLQGILRSRGRYLVGHFPDTLAIAQQSLLPRSHQAFKYVASALSSSAAAPVTGSPTMRVMAVQTMMLGVMNGGEALRPHYPTVLKVLARAATVKSSAAVREAGARGLYQMAKLPAVDKLISHILPVALTDSSLSVRVLGAEAMGVALGTHQRTPPNWGTVWGAGHTLVIPSNNIGQTALSPHHSVNEGMSDSSIPAATHSTSTPSTIPSSSSSSASGTGDGVTSATNVINTTSQTSNTSPPSVEFQAPLPTSVIKKLETLTAGAASWTEVLEAVLLAFRTAPNVQAKQMLALTFSCALREAPLPESDDELATVVSGILRLAGADRHDEGNSSSGSSSSKTPATVEEGPAAAAYVLRRGLSTRLPERLQLSLARYLLSLLSRALLRGASSVVVVVVVPVSHRRVALGELAHLFSILGDSCASLRRHFSRFLLTSVVNAPPSEWLDPPLPLALAACVRSFVVSFPRATQEIAETLLQGVMRGGGEEAVVVLAPALSEAIRGAGAAGRQVAVPVTSAFGLGKAYAAKMMDGSDPNGTYGDAGWDLLAALFTSARRRVGAQLPQTFGLLREALCTHEGTRLGYAPPLEALASILRSYRGGPDARFVKAAAMELLERHLKVVHSFSLGGGSTGDSSTLNNPTSGSGNSSSSSSASSSSLRRTTTAPLPIPEENPIVRRHACALLEVSAILEIYRDELVQSALRLLDSAPCDLLARGGVLGNEPQDALLWYEGEFADGNGEYDEWFEELVLNRAPSSFAHNKRQQPSSPGSLPGVVTDDAHQLRICSEINSIRSGSRGGGPRESFRDPRYDVPPLNSSARGPNSAVTYLAVILSAAKVPADRLRFFAALGTRLAHHHATAAALSSSTTGGGVASTFLPSVSSSSSSSVFKQSSSSSSHPAWSASNALAALYLGLALTVEEVVGEWLGLARDSLLAGLAASSDPRLRLASSRGLQLLCTRVARSATAFVNGTCKSLESLLLNQSLTQSHASLCARAGAVVTVVALSQGDGVFNRGLAETLVYESCRQTAQPLRAWSLHAWATLVSSTPPAEALRHVKPTLALVNTHLLLGDVVVVSSSGAGAGEEDPAARATTWLALARLCAAAFTALGPELAMHEDLAWRAYFAWRFLVGRAIGSGAVLGVSSGAETEMNRALLGECVRLVESFAIFHPAFALRHSPVFKRESAHVLMVDCAARGVLLAECANALLRLAEREPGGGHYRRVGQSRARALVAGLEAATRVRSPLDLVPVAFDSAYSVRLAREEFCGLPLPSSSSSYSSALPFARSSFSSQHARVIEVLKELVALDPSPTDWFEFARDVAAGASHSPSSSITLTVANSSSAAEEPATNSGETSVREWERGDDVGAVSHVMLRDLRWQARLAGIDLLIAIVEAAAESPRASTSTREALTSKMDALVAAAVQASTASVGGDSALISLQAQGLQLLSRVVRAVGPTSARESPSQPALRQYEMQIGAALRGGLASKAVPDLSVRTSELVALVAIHGIVSAVAVKRLLRNLARDAGVEQRRVGDVKNATSSTNKALDQSALGRSGVLVEEEEEEDEDDDEAFFARADEEEEEETENEGIEAKDNETADLNATDVSTAATSSSGDDAEAAGEEEDVLRVRLARLRAMADMLCAHVLPPQSPLGGQIAERADARLALAAAFTEAVDLEALARACVGVVRDRVVLSTSREARVLARHPEACYPANRTLAETLAILPLLEEVWSGCALAVVLALGSHAPPLVPLACLECVERLDASILDVERSLCALLVILRSGETLSAAGRPEFAREVLLE